MSKKDQKKYIEEVSKGDPVVTVGGIHGKVLAINDATVTLEVDKGSKLTVEKSSISMEASKRLSKGD